jgi:hypothetical protein
MAPGLLLQPLLGAKQNPDSASAEAGRGSSSVFAVGWIGAGYSRSW